MPGESYSPQAVQKLQATKLIRSIGQGALVVAFTLYLNELGWSAQAIGALLTAGGLITAALSLVVGAASDRLGQKHFLLGYEVCTIAAAVLLALTSHPLAIGVLTLLTGIGRNQSGAPGPMAPAEQAWMAAVVAPTQRGTVYSINSGLGFAGMGIGSLAAGLVPLWASLFPGSLAYRPLFVLTALGAVANLALLYRAPGGEAPKLGASAAHGAEALPRQLTVGDDGAITRRENLIMLQMALVNALNGVAVGLTSPLLSYWFALRFGVGPGALGPVFALTFLFTAVASVLTGRMSERIGLVRAVVRVRLAAVVMLLILPLIPSFWLASLVHVLRSALSRGSVGARQALAVTLVRQQRRGVASSINSISMALPNSIGPGLAGAMLQAGQLALPFYLAALLQFLFGVFYGKLFLRYDDRAQIGSPAVKNV